MAKKTARKQPARPAAKAARKPAVKKPARRVTARAKPPRKAPARKPARRSAARAGGTRTPWFGADHKPLISEYAKRLQPFIDTMADGRVDADELRAQEQRLVAAMKEVEPLLGGPLHAKVTRLLCEMAAYDLMQTLSIVQEMRPQTAFRG